jgi:hypothetical protein
MDEYFATFLGLAIIAHSLLFSLGNQSIKLPVTVFSLSYFVTTVIGATIIGTEPGYFFWTSVTFIYHDFSVLKNTTGFKYWFLLYSPLFIPQFTASLLVMILGRYKLNISFLPKLYLLNPSRISPLAFFISFSTLSFLCIGELSVRGLGFHVFNSFGSGAYEDLIFSRDKAFVSLSNFYFGMAYIGLPVLLTFALICYVRNRSISWLGNTLFSGAMIAIINLSTIQKASMMIVAIMMLVAMALIQALSIKRVLFTGGMAIAFLSMSYSLVGLGDDALGFAIGLAMFQIIFRMANAFPYYANVFPDTLPFSGFNYGFGLLGIGVRNDETQLIFDIMSSEKTAIQGNMAQAFHLLSGYVVDGYPGMILVELLLGVYFFLLARAIAGVKKPLSIAIIAHLVMVGYYLSQAGIVQVVMQSWGIGWVFLSVATLVGVHTLIDGTHPTRRSVGLTQATGKRFLKRRFLWGRSLS